MCVWDFSASPETQVKDMMTQNLIYLDSGDSLSKGMEIMLEKNIRHLPVVDIVAKFDRNLYTG